MFRLVGVAELSATTYIIHNQKVTLILLTKVTE